MQVVPSTMPAALFELGVFSSIKAHVTPALYLALPHVVRGVLNGIVLRIQACRAALVPTPPPVQLVDTLTV